MPNTPQEVLREKVERAIRAGQGPKEQLLKVVEKPGQSVRNSLVRSNPTPKEHCLRRACPMGDQGCKERCLAEGVSYVARCKRCWEEEGAEGGKVYLGESSRSVYTRAHGHYTDLRSKLKSGRGTSWMADHIQEAHGGRWSEESPWEDWQFSVAEVYKKPLNRQIAEFSAIRKAKTMGIAKFGGKEIKVSQEVFNSKEEWFSHISHWDTIM